MAFPAPGIPSAALSRRRPKTRRALACDAEGVIFPTLGVNKKDCL
jgi:hypothetical protein